MTLAKIAQLQDQEVVTEGDDLADEVIEVLDSSDEECGHQDTSRTFSSSTDVGCDSEDEDEDEDELGGWEHDESNAIYQVVRTPALKSSGYSIHHPPLPHLPNYL
jgi:hypothetical protein